jgi:hypothetical protein
MKSLIGVYVNSSTGAEILDASDSRAIVLNARYICINIEHFCTKIECSYQWTSNVSTPSHTSHLLEINLKEIM